MADRTRSKAFTLIELLVVIAIIALLIGILVPVLGSARDRARDTLCLANQRSISTAIATYTAEYDDVFPYQPSDLLSQDPPADTSYADCHREPLDRFFRDGDVIAPLWAPTRFADVLNEYMGESATIVQRTTTEDVPLFISSGPLAGYKRMTITDPGPFRCPRDPDRGGINDDGTETLGEPGYKYSKAFYHPPEVVDAISTTNEISGPWACTAPQRASSVLFPSLKIIAGDATAFHIRPSNTSPWELVEIDGPYNFLFPDGHAETVIYSELRGSNISSPFIDTVRSPDVTIDGIRGRDLGGADDEP